MIGAAPQENESLGLQILSDLNRRRHLVVGLADKLYVDALPVLPHPDLDLLQNGLQENALVPAYYDRYIRGYGLLEHPRVLVGLVIQLAYDLFDLFSCFFADVRPVVEHP